ncbi:hypothetical protein Leryth_005396 [Lithospermum erythrorhizon]|nr:hypothetical protein Leryth_005396 [Lithospermum erythrorhizon]
MYKTLCPEYQAVGSDLNLRAKTPQGLRGVYITFLKNPQNESIQLGRLTSQIDPAWTKSTIQANPNRLG